MSGWGINPSLRSRFCLLWAARIPLVADAAEEAEASTTNELHQLLKHLAVHLDKMTDN